jgi:SAM-dependent methyltransferase
MTEHPAARALQLRPPVDRLSFLEDQVRGKRVLDLGCLDDTATQKRGTEAWLHERLGRSAATIVGVDTSARVPEGGLDTGFSRILRGDVRSLDDEALGHPDVIVAGEIIEHVPDAVAFVASLRQRFSGSEVLLTTPNATGLTNIVLGLLRRESMHPDHLCVFSYRTLVQVFARAGVQEVELIPYRVRYTEARLRTTGVANLAVRVAERTVNGVERLVPMWSNGWIARARL